MAAEENFESLSSSVSESNSKRWRAEEKLAQKNRWDDVKAMDIFEVNDVEGMSNEFI